TTAGSAIDVTVTALDQFGNTDTNYVGTAHFTSSDALATLPSNYTFTSGTGPSFDNGTHTFTGETTLRTGGNQTITAPDTVTATITGTATVLVNKAASTTTVTSSANPLVFGQSVSFTATV